MSALTIQELGAPTKEIVQPDAQVAAGGETVPPIEPIVPEARATIEKQENAIEPAVAAAIEKKKRGPKGPRGPNKPKELFFTQEELLENLPKSFIQQKIREAKGTADKPKKERTPAQLANDLRLKEIATKKAADKKAAKEAELAAREGKIPLKVDTKLVSKAVPTKKMQLEGIRATIAEGINKIVQASSSSVAAAKTPSAAPLKFQAAPSPVAKQQSPYVSPRVAGLPPQPPQPHHTPFSIRQMMLDKANAGAFSQPLLRRG